ncbi:MAG TPA: hypothetical protein VMW89_02300 [Desulfatiglandales bacterium]|nr:hypothetical protein [Desulfatiglandales bacterium]
MLVGYRPYLDRIYPSTIQWSYGAGRIGGILFALRACPPLRAAQARRAGMKGRNHHPSFGRKLGMSRISSTQTKAHTSPPPLGGLDFLSLIRRLRKPTIE